MRILLLAAIAAGAALAATSPADARGGCGPGLHPTPYGCRPNYGPGPGPVVGPPGPPPPVIGTYYPRRGWWYGNRYWGHRYWHHGGWRYR